jgi:hypothetical protein
VVSATFTRTVSSVVESTIVAIEGDQLTFRHVTNGVETGGEVREADIELVLGRISGLLAEGFTETHAYWWSDSNPRAGAPTAQTRSVDGDTSTRTG